MSLAPGVGAQVKHLRSAASLWIEEGLSLVVLSGADAAAWLHGQCSQDILGLQPGRGAEATLLSPRGQVASHFWVARGEDRILLVVAAGQREALLARFDAYLFREEVTVRSIEPNLAGLWLQGPEAHTFESQVPELPWQPGSFVLDGDLLWARRSRTGEAGRVVYGTVDTLEEIQGELLAHGRGALRPMGDQAAEVARLEAGVVVFGQEVSEELLLPETPWMESSLGIGKGCYTGQEVVERLRSKGSPKLAMVGLLGPAEMPFVEVGRSVRIGGRDEGQVVASTPSPTLGGRLLIALLKRRHRRPGAELDLELEGGSWPVELLWMPPVPHRREEALADAAYDEAHARFAEDASDDDPVVITLLERCLALRPDHPEALELMGVALQRRGRLDEAKSHIEALLRMEPKSIMGWTNLSRIEAEAGRIPEAEAAQGQATMLAFQADLAKRKAARSEAKMAAQEAAERERRMGMFREVLSFDPDDLVARFGLGKALHELGEFAPACEQLQEAVRIKPDYAAAWLLLGRTLESLKRFSDARDAYEAGVAAAARRGELQPMRAMQVRLEALGAVVEVGPEAS